MVNKLIARIAIKIGVRCTGDYLNELMATIPRIHFSKIVSAIILYKKNRKTEL